MSNLKRFNQMIVHPNTDAYLTSVLAERKGEFINNLTAVVANDTKLQACEPVTLMYAALKATALRLPLDPNLGQAYIIPYKNSRERKTEAQFQIGWKGFIQLAIRSGQFQTINTTDIREGEMQGYDLMTGEVNVKAVPERENKPVVGYLAYFKLTNGFAKSLYMSAEEIEQHATRYSQSYRGKYKDSSLWTTDKDAMAKKTVLKLLLNRFAPLSVDMQKAVQADQSVLHGDGKLEYVDNSKNQLAEMAQAAMAEDVESEDLPTTQDPSVEYTAEGAQSPSNGTLFEDDVVTPNED
jgi:recombination protein RecT